MNKNILDFYKLAIQLKEVERTGWIEVGIPKEKVESVADHVYGTMMLAMAVINEKKLSLDIKKVYEMIAIKELKKISAKKEDSVITGADKIDDTTKDILNNLSNSAELTCIYEEYVSGETKEAKFALMISKLESDIQAKKYETDGYFTIENAKKDIENYPEEIKARLTSITNASDGWLEYDRKYYDDFFMELSQDVQKLK